MEYKIVGESFPAVICKLRAGETMVSQSGGMAWMSSGISMATSAGGLGKVLGRMFSVRAYF